MHARVGPDLINRHLRAPLLRKAWRAIEEDEEVQALVRMSNIMAVGRLMYNDHGPVHSRIVSGSALELFWRLVGVGVQPTTLRDGTASSIEEAAIVVLYGAYLHDIGNAVHRVNHELIGAMMAAPIIDRLLAEVLHDEPRHRRYMLRQEVMHAIYSTEMRTKALTMEAGVVKIADGTDMAEGRARIPYSKGKADMHAVSAMSIKEVIIKEGDRRPVSIEISMKDGAGIFQYEAVLRPKIVTSGISEYFEVWFNVDGERRRAYPEE